jgi:hypothetical protein
VTSGIGALQRQAARITPRRIATGAILDDLLGAGVVVGYVLRSSKSAGSHYEHS